MSALAAGAQAEGGRFSVRFLGKFGCPVLVPGVVWTRYAFVTAGFRYIPCESVHYFVYFLKAFIRVSNYSSFCCSFRESICELFGFKRGFIGRLFSHFCGGFFFVDQSVYRVEFGRCV